MVYIYENARENHVVRTKIIIRRPRML